METKEEQIVALPHFTSEEVEALKVEHERRELLFKGHALLDNDGERVRDAHQRENYWRIQIDHLLEHDMEHSPDMRHAEEELGHCLLILGDLRGAMQLTKRPEMRATIRHLEHMIKKDDADWCQCGLAHRQVVGRVISFKHGGKLTPHCVCVNCGFQNVAPA